MYTLILTLSLFTNGYKETGVATSIASIGGFQTNEACVSAGNAWLKKNATGNVGRTWMRQVNAVCVKGD